MRLLVPALVRNAARLAGRRCSSWREEGQDIIEYALILPFLLLLTFSIVESGLLIFRYNTVANAAREGARAGILPSATAGTVDTAAKALTTGLTPAPDIAIVFTDTTVEVTVSYTATLITAALIPALADDGSIPLAATATMQRE